MGFVKNAKDDIKSRQNQTKAVLKRSNNEKNGNFKDKNQDRKIKQTACAEIPSILW